MLFDEFVEVYREHFTHSNFNDKKFLPIKSLKYDENNINRFVVRILEGSHKEFQKDSMWRIFRNFLGEICSDLAILNLTKNEWITFSKKDNFLEVDPTVAFCLMIVVKRRVEKETVLKGLGLPDWLKGENYSRFYTHYNYIINNTTRVREILKGRPSGIKYFKDQESVIGFIKGKFDDKKIVEILEMTKVKNRGRRDKSFKDVRSFNKLAREFLKATKEEFFNHPKRIGMPKFSLDSQFKNSQITLRKAKKFLCYLGMMSTIQTYHDKPIEISSAREKAFFRACYIYFRKAAFKMNLLVCTDPTFCPGVKCKTFFVKVMVAKKLKAPINIRFNQLEMGYILRKTVKEKNDFAESRSEYALKFLQSKEGIFREQQRVALLNKEIKKLGFVINSYKYERGKDWTYKKYNELRSLQSKRKDVQYKNIDFLCTWSQKRKYDWSQCLAG